VGGGLNPLPLGTPLPFIFHNDLCDLFQQHTPLVLLIQYMIYRSDLHDTHWYSTKLLRSSFSYNWLWKSWSMKQYYSPTKCLVSCTSSTISTMHEPFLESWIPSHEWTMCNLERNKLFYREYRPHHHSFLQAVSPIYHKWEIHVVKFKA
jgi:hypothetical protein